MSSASTWPDRPISAEPATGPHTGRFALAGVVVVLRRGDLTRQVVVAPTSSDPTHRRNHPSVDLPSGDGAAIAAPHPLKGTSRTGLGHNFLRRSAAAQHDSCQGVIEDQHRLTTTSKTHNNAATGRLGGPSRPNMRSHDDELDVDDGTERTAGTIEEAAGQSARRGSQGLSKAERRWAARGAARPASRSSMRRLTRKQEAPSSWASLPASTPDLCRRGRRAGLLPDSRRPRNAGRRRKWCPPAELATSMADSSVGRTHPGRSSPAAAAVAAANGGRQLLAVGCTTSVSREPSLTRSAFGSVRSYATAAANAV